MPIATSPDTSLYELGKGIVYIAEFAAGVPGMYKDVGNCSKFDVEVTEESLDHFSSRSGTRKKDKTAILETGYTLSFDLDEISVLNMQMVLKAGVQNGHVLLANTALDKEYAIRFESDNPVGQNKKWEFWKCKLTPAGPISLISDDWQKLSFTGDGLTDTDNHADSPYFSVSYVTTTSTTTSSSTSTT